MTTDDHQPDVSVIVPVRDDPAGIGRTLSGLQRQTLAAERFEVVVVDNGSTDATVARARSHASAGPVCVRVLVEDRAPTSYAARNTGVAAARGRLLCFLDADMEIPPAYLATVAQQMHQRDLDYAGCAVDVIVDRPTVAACHNRLFGFPVAHYLRARGWAPTCCLTVRRAVLDDLGAFAALLPSGGDVELGRRVAAAGYRQGLIEGVRLGHPARGSLGALTRKARRTAQGKARLACIDSDHRDAVRAYASPARVRPLNPARVRQQLVAAGLPATWRRAVGVAAVKTWLDLVRLASAVVERLRLRRAA